MAAVRANSELSEPISTRLRSLAGVDPGDTDRFAAAVLAAEASVRTAGPVLFSTGDPHHLATNIAMAESPPEDAEDLLQEVDSLVAL